MKVPVFALAVIMCFGTATARADVLPVTSGLLYHLDAAAEVTKDASDLVSAWGDQSASNNDFSQGTASKQPLWVDGVVNSLPVIRFDGDMTDAAAGVAPNADELVLSTSTSPKTVLIVNSTKGSNGLAGIWGDENADIGIRRDNSSAWQHPGNSNTFSNSGDLYVNGEESNLAGLNEFHILVATGPSASTFGDTSLGDYFYNSTVPPRSWQGDIAEVLVYDRVLSDAELNEVGGYLADKYDIQWTAVPEPSMWALLVAGGLLALSAWRKRRS